MGLFVGTRERSPNSPAMPYKQSSPNSPASHHPLYKEIEDDLKLLWDVWHGLKNCKSYYLAQEDSEPATAYSRRLKRTAFDNRFKPAIKAFTGLLSEVIFKDLPQSLEAALEDVDLQGNDLVSFLAEADEMALRDGACGILVEFPPEPEQVIESNADLLQSDRRPYLVLIDRRDILNWRIDYDNGKPIISQVVICEKLIEPDGDFGSTMRKLYRVLYPGGYRLYSVESGQTVGSTEVVLIDEGVTTLPVVPLVWYSLSSKRPFEGDPPFLNLAELNIEHFQKRSDLNEVLHKCNLPVPVRRGFIQSMADLAKEAYRQAARLVIGPNSFIDVPKDGDFFWAEPSGSAIGATQSDVAKLEQSMDRMTLAFLTGGDVQKTATEAVLDSAQTQSNLKTMARRKESLVQVVLSLWSQYTGEELTGVADVDERVLQLPANPQDVQLVLDSMGVKFSNELGMKMLIERRWLPMDTDIEAEMAMLQPVVIPQL